MRLHVESIYGRFHGGDPRGFTPDVGCCTEKEIEAHKEVCQRLNAGETVKPDDSGFWVLRQGEEIAIICKSTFGIGVCSYVADDNANFMRCATWEDLQHDNYWEEGGL